MHLRTGSFSQSEWTEIISSFDDVSLAQTWDYGEAKTQTSEWHAERIAVESNGLVVSAAQALVRTVPVVGGGLAWVYRAPLWRRATHQDPAILMSAMARIREHWAGARGMYLRVAPPVTLDETRSQAVQAPGYRPAQGPAWASGLIDLATPLKDLRSGLRKNWRSALANAERQELHVEVGCGGEFFAKFLSRYQAFLGERRYDTPITPTLLAAMEELLPNDRKLLVVNALQQDAPVASVLIARYGNTCEYLAGVFPDWARAANGGQIVLWRAICEAKAGGFRWFDVGGMHPTQTPRGILQFKAGMAPTTYHLIGDMEVPPKGLRSRLIRWRVQRARGALGRL